MIILWKAVLYCKCTRCNQNQTWVRQYRAICNWESLLNYVYYIVLYIQASEKLWNWFLYWCAPLHVPLPLRTMTNTKLNQTSDGIWGSCIVRAVQDCKSNSAYRPSTDALQMKGQWESNINVWFPCMYSQKRNLLFPKQNYNVLSPSPYTHTIRISVRDLYISRIGLPILLQGNMWTNPLEYINRSQAHERGYWDWGHAQFPEKEYINGIFLAVCAANGSHLVTIRHGLTFDTIFTSLLKIWA